MYQSESRNEMGWGLKGLLAMGGGVLALLLWKGLLSCLGL